MKAEDKNTDVTEKAPAVKEKLVTCRLSSNGRYGQCIRKLENGTTYSLSVFDDTDVKLSDLEALKKAEPFLIEVK